MEDKLWQQQVGADARGADVTTWLMREDDVRMGAGARLLTQWPRRRWLPGEHRLQYCTEGLGSESSSDVLDPTHMFSAQAETGGCSRQPSGPVVVCGLSSSSSSSSSSTTTATMRAREFPPPLTSLLSLFTPPRVALKSKRQNGRLVLVETRAPSFSSPLTAHREHGRIRLLHLLHAPSPPGEFVSTSSGASARSSGNHATFGGGGSGAKEEEMLTHSDKNTLPLTCVIATTTTSAEEPSPPLPNGTSCGEHFAPPLFCTCSSWCITSNRSSGGDSSSSSNNNIERSRPPHCFLATAS